MKLNPVPSIHFEEVCKCPSTIPTPIIHRNFPNKRDLSIDEMPDFKENDTIHLLDFNLEKQMIVFYITICSLMKKRHFPMFLNVLRWIKNSTFSYNLVEIHYLYLIGSYVGQMQNLSTFGMLINLAPGLHAEYLPRTSFTTIKEARHLSNNQTTGSRHTIIHDMEDLHC